MATRWGTTWGVNRNPMEITKRSSQGAAYIWAQIKARELAAGGELPSTHITVWVRYGAQAPWEAYEDLDLRELAEAQQIAEKQPLSPAPSPSMVGTVLSADSPMPLDGTVLLLTDGTWERFSRLIGGASHWPLFANKYGRFVVGPDVDRLLRETEA
jgi:hypothetical protein